jgi:mono/diheme cytochrome c family protein
MKAIIAVPISIASAAFMMSAALDAAGAGAGAGKGPAPGQTIVERELIPGAHLMSSAEREQYRARMEAADGAHERARIRAEHIEAMDQRARSKGLSLLRRDPPIRTSAPAPEVRGAAARGAALHNVCFSCHGPERYRAAGERAASTFASSLAIAGGIEYAPPAPAAERPPDALPAGYPRMGRSQVRNLAGLKRAVARWNDYFSPKLSDQELDDLVAYLNAAYYRF